MPSVFKCLYLVVFLLSISTREVGGDAVSDLQTKGRTQINAQLAKSKTCTAANLQVRKEWGDVSVADRKAYIKAVLCLINAPSKLPVGKFPGAQTRYEDFVVTHMQQTPNIHGTGNFLSWHRYFTWVYEQALRIECGYNGTQPYWDFGKWAADPEKSPIFDGSDTSMSGNGAKFSHKATAMGPAQNGGGCVDKGPFAKHVNNPLLKDLDLGIDSFCTSSLVLLHLHGLSSPVSAVADPAPPRNPQTNGYGVNTRCLRRDIGPYLSTRSTTTAQLASVITSSKDIGSFQNTLQAQGMNGNIGIHSGAHYTIGSDPGGDFYTSPNDPAFWLLHGQIDRLWTIWQSQDLPNRLQVIAGGTAIFGGGQQKLTDSVDVSNVHAKVWQIKDLVSVTDGPFCYVYE
ncbi:hypothetical protein HYALB_00004950 [Hymenoscyphus albidus]|uniref:Tyrosinase copper-binding domain-containing protein n=1 Tax=Hymenoscyphus albidus TaxID=595503 RepID=A0A9N9LGU7_9HELO|nr:hypothetical protein HYALB_00004950 [Hymenoscyphus albidus]